ncbi:Hypothetical predicted protein, partial [Paramuricea clavata]
SPRVIRASNRARKDAIKAFIKKYPNADLEKFEFVVNIDLNGGITDVETNYKVDDSTSYGITSDGFKSNPEFVKSLHSLKTPTKWSSVWASGGNVPDYSSVRNVKHEWPLVWASGGNLPPFTNLREADHVWGLHHYPVFQKAVNLGSPLYNFKVYVSDQDYFLSKFSPIERCEWSGKAVLYENNKGLVELPKGVPTDIRNVSMDFENEPYFAQICSAYIATFLCGISVKNLEWNDSTPKQITSIARYHLYYTMRKFMKNPALMKKYDISGMKGHFPVKTQDFNGASSGGGTYVKVGWVNYTNSDYLHFIPYESSGITQVGVQLLMESVESYVYSVLGAQARTRWSIVSGQS